ncbi:MAG: hypothetical protein A2Y21_02180 [Clostridiales bacterium GWC2_40_7]|nr:MAG: hypothetical protein A2Y21_02180 [Clostridiales bacterium GWC2_40_7]
MAKLIFRDCHKLIFHGLLGYISLKVGNKPLFVLGEEEYGKHNNRKVKKRNFVNDDWRDLQEIVIDKEASGPARIVKGKYQGFSGKKGEPYLLVLDSKYRPFFYRFVVSTDELFNLLDFKLEIIFQSSH